MRVGERREALVGMRAICVCLLHLAARDAEGACANALARIDVPCDVIGSPDI